MKKPDVKSKMFGAPIPGQSLTKEPKSRPWERPPEMNDVNDVAEFYIDRTSTPSQAKKVLFLLEQGIPIRPIVKSALTSGVSRGLHNIDISLLVAPILHEHFVAMAEDAGIEYKEGLDDPKEKEIDREINKYRTYKDLKQISTSKGKDVVQEPKPTVDPEMLEVDEQETEQPQRRGLGSRRK